LLIFDLDETLIHVKRECEDDEEENLDNDFEPDVEIEGIYDKSSGVYCKASFSVRPYARECLAFANKYFEVAIFTAGNQWFAEPILNYLDPMDTLIQHRFYRQHTS
jgi:TFIIF-interacting CTD phosphatase-like protein